MHHRRVVSMSWSWSGDVGVHQARQGHGEESGVRVRQAVLAPGGAGCQGGHAGSSVATVDSTRFDFSCALGFVFGKGCLALPRLALSSSLKTTSDRFPATQQFYKICSCSIDSRCVSKPLRTCSSAACTAVRPFGSPRLDPLPLHVPPPQGWKPTLCL